jgi:glycosyltransferase involved in cell wall biosynthesis
MRLLFVHERFGALAGVESNLFATAAGLNRLGHTVAIIHGPETGRGEEAWRGTFSECFPLTGRNHPAAVQAALPAFKPDLVYVHKMADLQVIEALVEAGVPLVRMVHDDELYRMRSYHYHPFRRESWPRPASVYGVFPCWALTARNQHSGWPLQWVNSSANKREIQLHQQFDRLIVATNYMKEQLLRHGFDADKIEIHAPVPCLGDASLRSVFSERNVIIYAGQILRGKGVDVLLEALAEVRVPFECFIFGDGDHRSFCEQLSRKLGLAERVHFKGYVPHEELKHYYGEASVAVLSSVWPEPFGAVGLEGMGYGLPVVAFDAGGIKEWLLDGYNG